MTVCLSGDTRGQTGKRTVKCDSDRGGLRLQSLPSQPPKVEGISLIVPPRRVKLAPKAVDFITVSYTQTEKSKHHWEKATFFFLSFFLQSKSAKRWKMSASDLVEIGKWENGESYFCRTGERLVLTSDHRFNGNRFHRDEVPRMGPCPAANARPAWAVSPVEGHHANGLQQFWKGVALPNKGRWAHSFHVTVFPFNVTESKCFSLSCDRSWSALARCGGHLSPQLSQVDMGRATFPLFFFFYLLLACCC